MELKMSDIDKAHEEIFPGGVVITKRSENCNVDANGKALR